MNLTVFPVVGNLQAMVAASFKQGNLSIFDNVPQYSLTLHLGATALG